MYLGIPKFKYMTIGLLCTPYWSRKIYCIS